MNGQMVHTKSQHREQRSIKWLALDCEAAHAGEQCSSSKKSRFASRGTSADLRRLSMVGNADAFTTCQDDPDSLSNRGWRRHSVAGVCSSTAQRRKDGHVLLLYALLCSPQSLKGQSAASAWPNSAPACLQQAC